MNAEPNPEVSFLNFHLIEQCLINLIFKSKTSGLVHLTRLNSIARQLDDCCCEDQSIKTNSISLTNQSSYNNQSSCNNQSNDSASTSSSTNNQSHQQSNHTIIQHLAHNDCPSRSHSHSKNDRLEPERSYRSKSFVKHPHKTRLQSFSVIEKQDLYKQNTNISLENNSWSFKHLKNEFKANNFEKLFDKYQIRIQHNFYILLLLLNIGFNLIALALYFKYDSVSFTT